MLVNDNECYGLVSKLLHWTVAVLIIGLVALGWYMVDLTYYDRWYNASLEWHKALGIFALLIGALMVSWTLASRSPALPVGMSVWERLGARAMHATLLFMMVAIPATGYVISTSAGDGVSVFGWFQVPAVLPAGEGLRDLAIDLHYYFAYATAALVVLHGLAALKHQFVNRDGTLRRML